MEEQWTKPAGSMMLGLGRVWKNEQTLFFEFLSLKEEGGMIVYSAFLQGKPGIPFRLVRTGKEEAVFENLEHDFPKRVVYRKETDGSLLARIEGDGTETIRVQGVSSLKGCRHSVMGDRIEAGTFLAAGLATRGDVTVVGIDSEQVESALAKFEDAGAVVERGRDRIRLVARQRPRATDVTTQPFPGFPTDMQAQFMAALSVADGASVVTETIFENRFMHIPELCRLGADITVRGNSALVRGVDGLKGAPLMATDLRASASLVIGGLAGSTKSYASLDGQAIADCELFARQ